MTVIKMGVIWIECECAERKAGGLRDVILCNRYGRISPILVHDARKIHLKSEPYRLTGESQKQRFLKALGYLSSYDRPPEIDEQIQMHADTLYHRMLSQEKAIQEAKAAGHPTPEFPAILSPNHPPTTNTTTTPSPNTPATDPSLPPLSPLTQSLLNPPSQTKLRERLKKLTPMERELEERSVQMEARNAEDMARRMREVEEGRKKRREEGKGTAADTVAGWFGW